MKEIQLTQGKVAIVDDEDFEELSKYKWWVCNYRYASTIIKIEGKSKFISMHRFILKLEDNPNFVDHINGNGMDNRKENLRLCSNSQNKMNAKKRSDHKNSKYKGVSFSKDPKRKKSPWRVKITLNKKVVFSRYFSTELQAAKAYNEAAIKYFGEFAKLN